MLRNPSCWPMQNNCSRDPCSPFYRQRPPRECSVALFVVLVTGVVSLGIALVAFGLDNSQFFSFFMGAFIVLELVALVITCSPCIFEAFNCFRRPIEYQEVTAFTPSVITSGYGAMNNLSSSPYSHLPSYVVGSRLPPLKPHNSNRDQTSRFQFALKT